VLDGAPLSDAARQGPCRHGSTRAAVELRRRAAPSTAGCRRRAASRPRAAGGGVPRRARPDQAAAPSQPARPRRRDARRSEPGAEGHRRAGAGRRGAPRAARAPARGSYRGWPGGARRPFDPGASASPGRGARLPQRPGGRRLCGRAFARRDRRRRSDAAGARRARVGAARRSACRAARHRAANPHRWAAPTDQSAGGRDRAAHPRARRAAAQGVLAPRRHGQWQDRGVPALHRRGRRAGQACASPDGSSRSTPA
jgi:hypothetical protein